ncbi:MULTISPECIES: RNA polymerase sigma-70 factor [unclassified Siphonobacter]|uniref:RNA polymerase sigma-70 factor n=1 Tax=unclassified Siphonobacter TaxID=2635712 RepID=UPI002787AEC4|nr:MULTISPECIES: RNA polymerase sigma-70 factor [unclassified Siphonobacter]MDQ1089264.1 RNA polymerase sigma-70 factor (family 1) [Siphonobacter sp. SORGH_AS_1065]MDR6195441.1 RNA polymerase sigma-70 factor (family 1) [Siphonobacter sp. SORGH_AS_0500]
MSLPVSTPGIRTIPAARLVDFNPRNQMGKDTEESLQLLFKENPKKGCEALFKQYYAALCSHSVRLVYSKEVAEDIVSEVFCKFWSDRVYETVTTSCVAYLYQAVRNRSYNYLRWELQKARQSTDSHELAVVAYEPSPAEMVQFDELQRKVEQTIEQLPSQCKRVFLLSRFENRKYQEIAEELQISIKTVESHISKALATLRFVLKDEWIGCVLLALLTL